MSEYDAAGEPIPEPEEITDAEIVQPGEGAETAPAEVAPYVAPADVQLRPASGAGGVMTLYGSSDPLAIVDQVGKVATALDKVLKAQGLTTNVGGKKPHVDVEGWQVCGTFLGVQPVVVAVERTKPEGKFPVTSKRKKWGKVDGKRVIVEETTDTWEADGYSYRVWAEARTLDGRVVGKGVGFCSRQESKWQSSDEYAVIGMASTRAISRCMRQALGFVVAMAGYSATPTDEMPDRQSGDDEGPPFGPELTDEGMKGKLADALAYLMDAGDGPDDETGAKVWDNVVKDCNGYMPLKVARGLLYAAAALKAKVEQSAEPVETDPVQPDPIADQAPVDLPPASDEQPVDAPAEEG